MKVLLITVAGMSTRFSESIGNTCLKCIYHEGNREESLLYQLLSCYSGFDKFVIVGGFRYEELCNEIQEHYSEFSNRIVLVENKEYASYGSGYSLFVGLKKAMEFHPDQIVFAEGDLYVDRETFEGVAVSKKPVLTMTTETINAKKSVVFYLDMNYRIHYLYDLSHSALEIREPFVEIGNSGQVWKFINDDRLQESFQSMSEHDWQGTNLVFIQNYFSQLVPDEYEVLKFKKWINCNTISDFRRVQEENGR